MPIPFGLYRLDLVGDIFGQTTTNSYHFMTRGEDSPPTYQQELIELMNDFNENIVPLVCLFADQEWECNRLIGTTLDPPDNIRLELGPLALNGAQSGGALPSFCAAITSYKTAHNSPNFRGRSYYAGISKQFAEQGHIVGANLTQLRAIPETMLERYGGGAGTTRPVWGIFSPKLGRNRILLPLPHYTYNTGSGFRSIIQVVTQPVIGTSGHRRLGRGI